MDNIILATKTNSLWRTQFGNENWLAANTIIWQRSENWLAVDNTIRQRKIILCWQHNPIMKTNSLQIVWFRNRQWWWGQFLALPSFLFLVFTITLKLSRHGFWFFIKTCFLEYDDYLFKKCAAIKKRYIFVKIEKKWMNNEKTFEWIKIIRIFMNIYFNCLKYLF